MEERKQKGGGDRERQKKRDREKKRKKREREREKRYEEPLKTVEGKQSVQIQTGQSCLANLGQFAAGEKCRTPQVVYNTENI